MHKLIFIFLFMFSSCSLSTAPAIKPLETYLAEGWYFYIYRDKLVLVKDTPNGLLVNDYYNVLK